MTYAIAWASGDLRVETLIVVHESRVAAMYAHRKDADWIRDYAAHSGMSLDLPMEATDAEIIEAVMGSNKMPATVTRAVSR